MDMTISSPFKVDILYSTNDMITSSPFQVDTRYSIIGLNTAVGTPVSPKTIIRPMTPVSSVSFAGSVVSFMSPPKQDKSRKQRSPRKKKKEKKVHHIRFNNIQEQLDFSQVKYDKIVDKYMNTPCCRITEKKQDDVWAWGLFSEVVLPMLTFIDE
jgi:hypothetical protein